jgi:hypothetical protein
MKVLTETEYQLNAEPALRRIFLNDNPLLPTFGEAVEIKKILYEYRTPDTQITAVLAQVASQLGDDGFFFSNLLRKPNDLETANHWWIPFDEMSIFLSCNTDIFNFAYQLENVIYSPSGQWGLMWAFENFGILAGTSSCIDRVCQIVPSIEQQILYYLDHIKECKDTWGIENMNITWLPSFLEYVFGEEVAVTMLEEAQLID